MNWTDVLGSISGALGPVGSIVGGLITNKNNKDSNNAALAEQQRQFDAQLNWAQKSFQQQLDYNKWAVGQQFSNNYMLNQQQQEWNERMWNMANEYNSPVEQMKRLRAGGLNPFIMMGNSGSLGSGNASSLSMGSSPSTGLSSAPSASVPSGHVPSFIPYQNPAGNGFLDSLVNNLFVYKNRSAESRLVNANADNITIRNLTEYAHAIAMIDNLKADTKSKDSASALNDIQTKLKKATFSSDVQTSYWNMMNTMQQNAVLLSHTASINLQNQLLSKQIKWFDGEARARINNLAAQTYAAYAAGKKSYAEAKKAAAETVFLQKSPQYNMTKAQAELIASTIVDKSTYEAMQEGSKAYNLDVYGASEAPTTFDSGSMEIHTPFGTIKSPTSRSFSSKRNQ